MIQNLFLQQFTFLEQQSSTMRNRITESNEFDSVEQNTRDRWFSSRSHLTLRISLSFKNKVLSSQRKKNRRKLRKMSLMCQRVLYVSKTKKIRTVLPFDGLSKHRSR